MKNVSKTKKNTEIRHIKVEAKHGSVIKPFGPSKPLTEQIPSTDEIAKNYVEIDEELVESIDIMKLQDEGLLFLFSRSNCRKKRIYVFL